MAKLKVLGRYRNGNYNVTLYNDGTKIRENSEDKLIPDFPECIDLNISNQCLRGCPFCYLDAKPTGKHGRFDYNFFKTLKPYTELAINFNSFEQLPDDLETWLFEMRERHIIVNLTINANTLTEPGIGEMLAKWKNKELIHGIGISISHLTNETKEIIQGWDNVVLHVICGIINKQDLYLMANEGYKVLFLGYKTIGRGANFEDENPALLEFNLKETSRLLDDYIDKFKVCAFDNLALEQLNIKDKISTEEWNKYYMGDDGQYTMYIDLVTGTFAKNSISMKKYKITNNIKDMFNTVRNEK